MKTYSMPFFKISLLTIFLFLNISFLNAQSTLSVEKIMQDPAWMGTFPSNISWSADSKTIYFDYNPEKNTSDSLYKVSIGNLKNIDKVGYTEESQRLSRNVSTSQNNSKKIFTRDGKLMIYDLKTNTQQTLLDLGGNIINPVFLENQNLVSFSLNDNLYTYNVSKGTISRITNLKSGEEKSKKEKELSPRDQFLEEENLGLLGVVKKREDTKLERENYRNSVDPEEFTFYTGDKRVDNLQLSPNSHYATFNLITRQDDKNSIVPNYVDASGYTVDLPSRSKVGDLPLEVSLEIYDLENDTVYSVQTNNLPGIKDLPVFTKDYPDKKWEEKDRDVAVWGPYFSRSGKNAIVSVRSLDNKDRWICSLNLNNGTLKVLDRQHDDAWINGPGIGYPFGGENIGWLPDNSTIYYQSEETGYSHLYLQNVQSGKKEQLTSGKFEVFDPFLSLDKKSWYLTTSEEGADVRNFYKMPVHGGKMERLTQMKGNNDVSLSPDEKYLAILYSYSNKPWELYVKKNNPSEKPVQVTNGQSEEFKAYSWRDPEIIQFKAEDGTMVPARIYEPTKSAKNGAAVIFVHGAGYLQNVHKWWSSYFREYMFNNLLTDLGYTVLDIDYRGSAGYGRDWRTAIYRHMGDKDLSDQVDGVKFLVENKEIDASRVGIYGGSYGGFITLMAMFNEPGTFNSGAALRSVTDWAHYNDAYTSNILNDPFEDPIAYRRSSPIYFAEGLQGNLLIAHGMVDTNVHFQDVVRLAQRLIELKKDNWEMAVYPVESHGFVEPSSWTDEYKRILKLFNENLLPAK